MRRVKSSACGSPLTIFLRATRDSIMQYWNLQNYSIIWSGSLSPARPQNMRHFLLSVTHDMINISVKHNRHHPFQSFQGRSSEAGILYQLGLSSRQTIESGTARYQDAPKRLETPQPRLETPSIPPYRPRHLQAKMGSLGREDDQRIGGRSLQRIAHTGDQPSPLAHSLPQVSAITQDCTLHQRQALRDLGL